MKERHIAINVRHLIPNKMEGIGWFTYQMIKRITENHPHIHFYFLFDSPFHPDFIFNDNITPIILYPPARHPLLIYYWNEWAVPNLLNKLMPDVYISTDGFISHRAKYKQYAVVHDVNFLVSPTFIPWSYRKLYEYFFVKHIHHAQRIATVSEFSKSEIKKYLNFPEDKIDVVYSASNLQYREVHPDELSNIKKKYTSGKNYFLYISSIHARKNVDGLIHAFNEYKRKSGSDDKLLLVGRFFWGKKKIMQLANHSAYHNDIIFTGRVDEKDILPLIKSAKAFILVSHYEGFGVPIIEAMQAGTPVITSNTTSLNEIANDAAIKVNPNDINAIADAMLQIHTQPHLVHTLIQKGKQQAEKFNWDNLAQLLWQGIEKVLN